MRNKIVVVLLLLLWGGNSLAQIQTFEWQNTQRQYIVRIPAEYDETMPVMYFLHGLGDNITRLDNEFQFQQISDRFGWMIVVPQAINQGYGTMWNAGLNSSTIDDSGFLMALLDKLATEYPVNQDSIFFTGFSMGGFMSHRMGVEHGDRINACAPVSGLLSNYIASHTAVAPVRMMHVHGTNDPVVGYDGGSQYFGYQLGLSVENILNYWKNVNGCDGEPVIDPLPDTQADGLLFIRYSYNCGTQLEHLKIIGGEHEFYHNANLTDISLIDEIHDFFVGKGGYDAVENMTTGSFELYPNPTSGKVKINVEYPTTMEVVNFEGQSVMREEMHAGENVIDFSNLPKGIYFVKDTKGTATKVVVR